MVIMNNIIRNSLCVGLLLGTFQLAQAQNAQAELQAAAQAHQRGDSVSAFNYLYQAAQKGDPVAAYNLSVAYGNGDGVAQDQAAALQWLQRAAQAGYPPAQYDLALYFLSTGRAQEAAPLMKALADNGDAAAQFNYGIMLTRGDGVKKNVATGKQYIQKAAAQGFPPAQQHLQQN